MNASEILKYGHLIVCRAVDGLAESDWNTGGVCGPWSVKDIIGHLAAYEHVLEDVLNSFFGGAQTDLVKQYASDRAFNDLQAAARKDQPVSQVWSEYNDIFARVTILALQVPRKIWREPGTLPWYGENYALDDFVVYAFYGHKREHSAQIAAFREKRNGHST